MPENRFDEPVQAAIDRRTLLRTTKLKPSDISRPRCASGPRSGLSSRLRIRPTKQRRADEAHRVDDDRVRRRQRLDQEAGRGRAGELAHALHALELGVAFHETAAPDEVGQVALISDVEEHRGQTGAEADDVELRHRQPAHPPGKWHAAEQDGTGQVAGDHDIPPAQPVHQRAGGQPDDQERRRIGGGKKADLEGARVQRKHGYQRQCELRDLAADLAHGVS